MRHYAMAVIVSALWILSSGEVVANQQTERFIPIGQSPGLSNKSTDVGRIRSYDASSRMLSVDVQGGSRSVKVTGDTRIWLDRSKQKQTNLDGSVSDLQAGRTAEVSYTDPTSRDSAAWIKVEVAN